LPFIMQRPPVKFRAAMAKSAFAPLPVNASLLKTRLLSMASAPLKRMQASIRQLDFQAKRLKHAVRRRRQTASHNDGADVLIHLRLIEGRKTDPGHPTFIINPELQFQRQRRLIRLQTHLIQMQTHRRGNVFFQPGRNRSRRHFGVDDPGLRRSLWRQARRLGLGLRLDGRRESQNRRDRRRRTPEPAERTLLETSHPFSVPVQRPPEAGVRARKKWR